MALVAHTIYSHHNVQERETSPTSLHDDSEDEIWHPSDARKSQSKPHVQSHFVAARIPLDEYGRPLKAELPSEPSVSTEPGPSVSGWYRNLRREVEHPQVQAIPKQQSLSHRSNSTPPAATQQSGWFTSKPFHNSRDSSSDSIADRLLSAKSPTLKPPVWIALGPSNKGYEMLSKSGWQEGEGLGMRVSRSVRTPALDDVSIKGKEKEIKISDNSSGIIDLTLSDDDDDDFSRPHSPSTQEESYTDAENSLPSGGVSLLTPLPTTLKSDRLGVGNNAIYITTSSGIRIPKRRITHGEKALRAHVETADRDRMMRLKWGKGARGQHRRQKAESKRRQELLAIINS